MVDVVGRYAADSDHGHGDGGDDFGQSIGADSLVADATGVSATSPSVVGKVYAADYASPTPSNLTTAIGAMETAYTDAAGRTNPRIPEASTSAVLRPGDSLNVSIWNQDELTRDVQRLTARWEDIESKVAEGKAPELLYEQLHGADAPGFVGALDARIGQA